MDCLLSQNYSIWSDISVIYLISLENLKVISSNTSKLKNENHLFNAIIEESNLDASIVSALFTMKAIRSLSKDYLRGVGNF